jgi:uncharacterized damage-inducible protein DinB
MSTLSRTTSLFVAVGVLAVPVAAQTAASPASRAAPPAAAANTGVQALRAMWNQITQHITSAAEELSEADYAYRPTPEVRTFGQLVGHVAGAQYMICAAALGEAPRAEDEIEKSRTTKAALVEALKASTVYCNRAYALTDAALGGETELFGQKQTKMQALALNAVHNGEHYGNIVTYMRMKGMVPPSSRPRR